MDRDSELCKQVDDLTAINTELLEALKAFVEQATKLQGFPEQYQPYVGQILLAKAAISRAEGRA